MKKLSFLTTLVLFLSMVSFLSAETVMIKFVSGNVKVKNSVSGKWVKAKIKMKIDDSSILKIGKNSKVQILTRTGKIAKVSAPKTVKIQNLFTSTTSGMQSKLAMLKSKLSKGKSGSQYAATAVAGVRGADVQKQRAKQMKQTLFWEE